MAGKLGKRVRKELINHLTGKTPDTTAAGVWYLALETDDPGVDGQTNNEATGTSYARVGPLAATDFVAATNADPSVGTTATDQSFAQAGGDWSSGAVFKFVSVWDHATSRTEAHYIGAFALSQPKAALNGDTIKVPADDLSLAFA